MKNLLFLLMFFPISTFSQNDLHPFPEGEAEWSFFKLKEEPMYASEDFYTIKMTGDTVLNGTHYNIMGGTFVRNEGNKVYRLNNDNDGETLLYDFNLQQGDIFKFWHYVLEVDSIQMEDSSYRKRWHLATVDNDSVTTWIEGIGFSYFYNQNLNNSLKFYRHLVCFKEEGEEIFSNPHDSFLEDLVYNCDGIVAGNEEINLVNNQLLIIPNPAKFFFNLSFPLDSKGTQEKIKSIIVYDLKGKIMFEKQYKGISSTYINTELWSSGVYISKVNDQFINKILITK